MAHVRSDPMVRRTARQRRFAVGAALAIIAQIGCASRNAAPETTSAPYAGPALSFDRSGSFGLIVMQGPTPGWQIVLDRVNEGFESRDVFVTIRKPNPEYAYAQVIVEQRVATNILPAVSARLYARLVTHAAPAQPDSPYSFVAAWDPVDPGSSSK